MAKLGVSILSELNNDYIKTVKELIENGVERIHYDIMDGRFVKNTSFSFEQVEKCIKENKKHFVDIHLMVNDPEHYCDKFMGVADQITFHHEALNYKETKKLLNSLKQNKNVFKVGIAINPKTNVEQIYEYLPLIDSILVMSVVPGKGGQLFIPDSLNKIRKIKQYISKRNMKVSIEIDGGVNIDNCELIVKVGTDVLTSGSYITKNLKSNIKKFNKSIVK